MIKLDLAPDEEKVLAYACGYALRVLEESSETSEGKKGQLRELLSKLTTAEPSAGNVSLKSDVASSLAVSMQAARMDFEADFLDWRTFRHDRPHLAITTFEPLARVWQSLFADILKNPEGVVLVFHPYSEAWHTARLKLQRGLGTESPSDLRAAILAEHVVRLGTERRLQERLLVRMEAIAAWRAEIINAVDSQSTECPTCGSELEGIGPFCWTCAEVFPKRLPRDDYTALGALTIALQGLRVCGLLEGFIPTEDHEPREECDHHNILGRVPLSGAIICPACGRLQVSYNRLLFDVDGLSLQDVPETSRNLPSVRMAAVVRTLSSARRSRIVYNIARGFPALRTYGATSLGDPEEVEAANARKWEEMKSHSDSLKKHIQEMGEISEMAGLE